MAKPQHELPQGNKKKKKKLNYKKRRISQQRLTYLTLPTSLPQ